MRLSVFCTAITVSLSVSSFVQSATLPLYETFESFCVDTGSNPAAVKAALEKAGAKSRVPLVSTDHPFAMNIAIWDYAYNNEHFIISTGVGLFTNARTQNKTQENNCIVQSLEPDAESVNVIQHWVGVAPIRISQRSPEIFYYKFLERGKSRFPLPTDPKGYEVALREGQVWGLVLLHSSDGASVQYVHDVVPDSTGHPR